MYEDHGQMWIGVGSVGMGMEMIKMIGVRNGTIGSSKQATMGIE